MIVELNSVGSVVDDQTYMVYAKFRDGGFDENSGVDLGECTSEWFSYLDEWDKNVVKHLLDIKNEKEKRKNFIN